MWIYLLHYQTALHHSQHYLGISDDPEQRIATHARGEGSSFTAEMARLGINFSVGMLAQCSVAKSRQYERTLKQSKNLHRYCDFCNAGLRPALQLPGTTRYDPGSIRRPLLPTRQNLRLHLRLAQGGNEVLRIANECSNAVGFITAEALRNYGEQRRLVIAEDCDTAGTVGYLAFSLSRGLDTLTIVQTAVTDQYRGMNIGRGLVDFVRHMWPRATATCKVRYDLPANLFWTRIGFHLLQTRRHTTSKNRLHTYQIEPVNHIYRNGSK
jgi:predicted GIY-YIG superfamily endonuclease/GNAT superfamily N-acetyltransferase